jgi:hypothetical protein
VTRHFCKAPLLLGFEFINENKIIFYDIAQSEFKQPDILAQNRVSWQAEQGSAPACTPPRQHQRAIQLTPAQRQRTISAPAMHGRNSWRTKMSHLREKIIQIYPRRNTIAGNATYTKIITIIKE